MARLRLPDRHRRRAVWPILLIAAAVGFCRAYSWLCGRYPRTMYFVSTALSGFVSGLVGGDGDHAAPTSF